MKQIKTLQELKKEYNAVKDGVAGDTIFIAQALMFLIEMLSNQFVITGKAKRKRKSTAWNKFAGEQMKKGKSLKEAAELYQKKKGGK